MIKHVFTEEALNARHLEATETPEMGKTGKSYEFIAKNRLKKIIIILILCKTQIQQIKTRNNRNEEENHTGFRGKTLIIQRIPGRIEERRARKQTA